jgi:hypothetical protein
MYAALELRFPLLAMPAKYPGSDEWSKSAENFEPFALCGVIWRLNDVDKWTREQIADWVETIEQAQSQPAPEAERVCHGH